MVNIDKLIYLVPVICGLYASYTDIRERKIRNKITYTMILSGILFQFVLNSLEGLKNSVIGILISLILLSVLPGFKFSGGDMKLIMGFGSYLGLKTVYYIILVLAMFVLVNTIFIIKKHGIKNLLSRLKLEVITVGKIAEKGDKIAGAPILLSAFIITILILHGGDWLLNL